MPPSDQDLLTLSTDAIKSVRRVQEILVKPFELQTDKLLCRGELKDDKTEYKVLDDLTVFMKAEAFMEQCHLAMGGDESPKAKVFKTRPYLCTVDLSGPVKLSNGKQKSPQCRLHAALCCGGQYYAITLRDPPAPSSPCAEHLFAPSLQADPKKGFWQNLQNLLNFDSIKLRQLDPSKTYLTNAYQTAEIVYNEIFAKSSDSTGLVLVTGGTGSGKTTVMNALLGKYLISLFDNKAPEVRPRVFAAGDPVETSFYTKDVCWWKPEKKEAVTCADSQMDPAYYFKRPIDFVPRTIGTDVESVECALRDALRETTSAYVVSELRDAEDFKATLNFAATGQIIFATAHNTSLIDAIRKLSSFSQTPDIPSSRSLLAQRLKAVIHLRVLKSTDGSGQAALPSVWINNARGIRNFVCDGLASLLPHTDSPEKSPPGVLGLGWAAEQLLKGGGLEKEIRESAHAIDLSVR